MFHLNIYFYILSELFYSNIKLIVMEVANGLLLFAKILFGRIICDLFWLNSLPLF